MAISFFNTWLALDVVRKKIGPAQYYIDYHLYLTNLFPIPPIWFFVLDLKDKMITMEK